MATGRRTRSLRAARLTSRGTELEQSRRSADVVIVGAGAAGLAAAVAARDEGASVILVEANYDIGGHAMLSGGKIALGGGTSLQEKFGVVDSPDQVYLDHTSHTFPAFCHADRELVRVWADENVATFDFLVANGVVFEDNPPTVVYGGSVPRQFRAKRYSDDMEQTINGRGGSGVVRHLEDNARAKGVTILVRHRLVRLLREGPLSGRVTGIVATVDGEEVEIAARQGVILTTGGHTSNVEFRTRYDPRLTEEYQTAGEPWTAQDGSGELAAMAIGAAFLATGAQENGAGVRLTKTRHIGCRWGYRNLKWDPDSPMFEQAGASGLTVEDHQDLIYVNQVGRRFWDETDDSSMFLHAALGTNGNLGRDGKANGGGPIWAIFDAAACRARAGTLGHPTSTSTVGSSAPAPWPSWRPRSSTPTSGRRCRGRPWTPRSPRTTRTSNGVVTPSSASPHPATRSSSRPSTPRGPRRSSTTP